MDCSTKKRKETDASVVDVRLNEVTEVINRDTTDKGVVM